jgi:uncharacterized protein (DUF849 family)
MERLLRLGMNVEAGLASVADAERLVALGLGPRALRILIEVAEQDEAEALSAAADIRAVLSRANLRRPLLLHGFDAMVWRFVTLAAKERLSARVGLEDGCLLPDATMAVDNAALISSAVAVFGEAHPATARSR